MDEEQAEHAIEKRGPGWWAESADFGNGQVFRVTNGEEELFDSLEVVHFLEELSNES